MKIEYIEKQWGEIMLKLSSWSRKRNTVEVRQINKQLRNQTAKQCISIPRGQEQAYNTPWMFSQFMTILYYSPQSPVFVN